MVTATPPAPSAFARVGRCDLVNRSLIAALGVLSPIVLGGIAHAQVTLPRAAAFKWTIDGRSQMEVSVIGILQPTGKVVYESATSTPEGIELSFKYTVDPTNNPTALISGWIKAVNFTNKVHGIDASVVVPLCPDIPGGTLLGGNVVLQAAANATGGAITCLPGSSSIWQVLIGEQPSHNSFFCPFVMSTTGAGTMQTSNVFGAPIPSLPGPSSAPNAGTRNRFSLTPGDALTITSNVLVKSLGVATSCMSDLDGNGEVDAVDLGIMLGAWGDHSNLCLQADINADMTVDAKDLSTLLGQWGPCN